MSDHVYQTPPDASVKGLDEVDDLLASVNSVLGEVVLLGDTPTAQEQALGEAVAAHLAERQQEDEP